MFVVEVNGETCDGPECMECIEGCPVEMLGLVEYVTQNGGEKKQISGVITDMADCIGCGACEATCPTGSITVTEY
ncbi:4Fe-4S dicluster domain-containing protein [Candidatus Parcubacteria bacterium]|nr:MAG: 4Fe-4S dicluster domain-containing protein [Candidatus Parcubacteria bacterium]